MKDNAQFSYVKKSRFYSLTEIETYFNIKLDRKNDLYDLSSDQHRYGYDNILKVMGNYGKHYFILPTNHVVDKCFYYSTEYQNQYLYILFVNKLHQENDWVIAGLTHNSLSLSQTITNNNQQINLGTIYNNSYTTITSRNSYNSWYSLYRDMDFDFDILFKKIDASRASRLKQVDKYEQDNTKLKIKTKISNVGFKEELMTWAENNNYVFNENVYLDHATWTISLPPETVSNMNSNFFIDKKYIKKYDKSFITLQIRLYGNYDIDVNNTFWFKEDDTSNLFKILDSFTSMNNFPAVSTDYHDLLK